MKGQPVSADKVENGDKGRTEGRSQANTDQHLVGWETEKQGGQGLSTMNASVSHCFWLPWSV